MATEKKIDYVILGLLSHEELTGYEIKNRIDTTLKYFWSASYGSIYPALSDLVNRGLATKKDELRYETLLKLFFGNEQGAEQALLHIKSFEEKIKKELPYLLGAEQALKNCLDDDATHKYYLLTVQFGIKTYHSYLEWCEEAKKFLMEKENG